MIPLLITVVGRELRGPVRGLLALLVGHALLAALTFLLVVPLVDALLVGRGWWGAAGAVTVAAVGTLLTGYAQAMLGFRVGQRIGRRLHHRLGDHLARLPVGWFSHDRVGELGRLLSGGVREVTGLFAHHLAPLVGAVVTPAAVVVGLLVIDWRIGVTEVAVAVVILAVRRGTGARVRRADAAAEAAAASANTRLVEFSAHQPTLRIHGRAVGERLLDEALTAQDRAVRRQIRTQAPGRYAVGLTTQLGVAAVVLVAVALATDGTSDVAATVAALLLTVRFAEPVGELGELGATLRSARGTLERMRDVLAASPLPEPSAPIEPVGTGGLDLALRGVTVTHAGATAPVLRDVSFTVPAGTTTALVGPSGSGKSTLLRLVARFTDVDDGAITLGGVDVRAMAPSTRTSLVAPAFQDPYLFDTTIEENVRTGRPDATDADVRAAMRVAGLTDVLDRLPQGADTPVGEGGTALSGGERARVALARAVLTTAPVLLLDEVTAALDPATERAVTTALSSVAGRRTVLVVAHRAPVVASADQIVVLGADGTVTECGSHEELVAVDGTYAASWARRRRIHSWRLTPSDDPT